MLLASCHSTALTQVLSSLNGNLVVTVNTDQKTHRLSYEIRYKGRPLIDSSRLGFVLSDSTFLGRNVRLLSVRASQTDTTWKPLYGERDEIPDQYRQLKLELQESDAPHLKFNLILRAYDEGIAFRYEIPRQDSLDTIRIDRELTAFNFPGDVALWVTSTAQGMYERVSLSSLKGAVERPLVVECSDSVYAAIGEAAGLDYPRMRLARSKADATGLVSALGSEVTASLPLKTPWRYVMAGDRPGELLEHNFLVENLNEPNQIQETSWVKPGKVIRETTLTTQGGLACVDFAANNGLQYVEFDAGWYGNENSDTSDATRVAVDPARSKGPLDLQKVIRYADTKGVGIILYVNRRALERQLDTLLPLYRSWGVKGVKYGFVRVGTQKANTWLMGAVRKAAENHLMVDIHDEYRPTGYSRTYPNLMTQEGVRGDEESPSNAQTVATVFTRMIAGAADHTVCYFGPRVEKMGSHVSQLAKTICLYSPWQFLFWYDKPAASPGKQGATTIQNVPELSFYKDLPTVWDDTRVLEGSIGNYVTILRRKGSDFYVGCINGAEAHRVDISLGFLKPGQKYTATIYADGKGGVAPTHVEITTRTVADDTRISQLVQPHNGLVIVFRPD